MKKVLVTGGKDICDLLNDFLSNNNFQVDCVNTSDEMYATLSRENFDLILYDYRVQDESGLDLIARIRAFKPALPVIMLSNDPALKVFIEAVQQGAVDCITDPLNTGNVLTTIQTVLLNNVKVSHPKDPDDGALTLKDAAHRAELGVILRVLKEVNNNRTKAAAMLNIDRKTLYNKLKNMGLAEDGDSHDGMDGK